MANTFRLSGVSASQLPQVPREMFLTSLRHFLSLLLNPETPGSGEFLQAVL